MRLSNIRVGITVVISILLMVTLYSQLSTKGIAFKDPIFESLVRKVINVPSGDIFLSI